MVRLVLPPRHALKATLDASSWRQSALEHKARIAALVGDPSHIDRRHPVYNFIFTYYSFDPKLLLRYSAGQNVLLTGVGVDEADLWCGKGWLPSANGGAGIIDARLTPKSLRRATIHAANVLRASSQRAPHYNCYGLHEWAMLYGGEPTDFNRHQELPLRVTQAELNRVVESLPLKCTHFDAFRFFTPDAAPRNQIVPTPSRFPSLYSPSYVAETTCSPSAPSSSEAAIHVYLPWPCFIFSSLNSPS